MHVQDKMEYNNYNEYMMVHQLLLTNHLILTHLQDIRKHMLRSQNIARYQQRTQSLVPWP